jgi:hypothetical protein
MKPRCQTPRSAQAGMTPQLDGQTVVVIGGSADIGLATARAAREEGTEVILAARKRERLDRPRRRSARAARPPSTRSTRLRSTGSCRPPCSCSRRICGGASGGVSERVVTVRISGSGRCGPPRRLDCAAPRSYSRVQRLTKGQSWLSRLEIESSSRRSRPTVQPAGVWWRRLCATSPFRGIESAGTTGMRASTRRRPGR